MPNSSKGNSAIHADLLNYPSDSWQWEIIADTGGEKAYNLWYISLSQLERQFIHQFDSVRNGYNIVEGSPVNYSQTLDEPYLSWGIKTFHRSEMQQVIYNAIERQQLEEQRQRDVSYLRGAHKSPYRKSVIRCVTFLRGLPQIELTNIASCSKTTPSIKKVETFAFRLTGNCL